MSTQKISFYNLAWRWHFYAGLFVAPFMVLLALTGIIYLFKPQLDPLMYGHLLTVPAAERALSADEQLQRAKAAYPQGRLSKYLPPADATSSAQFVMHNGGREMTVFVDPYRGTVPRHAGREKQPASHRPCPARRADDRHRR